MPRGAGRQRGVQRERSVRDLLIASGWVAFRAPASLGVADVIALKAGQRPKMIEVKSTAGGPYERFSPADRAELRLAAELAGAEALLAYWPSRKSLQWIPSDSWPKERETA